MEELMDRIVIDPDVLVGKSVIKGTRIPVYLLIELLANGIDCKGRIERQKRMRHQ